MLPGNIRIQEQTLGKIETFSAQPELSIAPGAF